MSDKASIIREAQKYLARGQVDRAISEWEKLLKESPDGNTYNIIGDLYLKKGDKRSAVDFFNKAAGFFRNEGFSLKALALYKKILNINPATPDALRALGELSEEKGLSTDAMKYYISAADILTKEGKKDAILKIYDKILNLSPSNIPLRNKVAELYIKEGLSFEAAKEFLNIARLYEDKDDFSNAEKFYKKAVDLSPNYKEALTGLGALSERTGKTQQSIDYIRKALEAAPQDTELSLKYAQVLIQQKSYAAAMPYLTKAVQADPSNITAKKLLADLYLKEGDKERAWEEYRSFIDEMAFDEKTSDEAIGILSALKDIEPVETRRKLIPLYKQKGDSQSAFEELVSLGDTFVLMDNSMPNEALACYREALQIHPKDKTVEGKIADIESETGEIPESEKAEKPIEESLAEADIFLRYGLYDEARALLESLKLRDRENIEVHTKLKSLYIDTGEKEQAIAECLILADLHHKSGNIERREVILKEAYEINPEDPRLLERAPEHQAATEFTASSFKTSSVTEEAAPRLENYSEDITEAEFYTRQGLHAEAKAIYQKLLKIFPGEPVLKEKLAFVDKSISEPPSREKPHKEKPVEELKKPAPSPEPFIESTEEYVMNDILEAQEPAPEPVLGNDVMDIFNEFKKGIEKELGSGDSETHYNLGIAYKEMGLLDDAIREFQVAKNDPKNLIPATNMLGICYAAKGLFPLAIESFKDTLSKIGARDESYWGVQYDLAEAYEKNGDTVEALRLCTELYGWNSKFRNISDKINSLKTESVKSAPKTSVQKPKPKKERISYL